jgi:hypothetical protein
VDQPVNAEKVELVEDRHEQRKASEIERMLREREPGRVAVGEGEEDPDLVGRPDRHARPESPDDTLEVLAAEQEGAVLLVIGKFGVVLEAVSLSPRHVEPVFEGAVE